MYAVARDVTEKLRTEGALRQSEERYRMLFTTMAEGVLLLDPRGAIVAVNPSAERLLGAPSADLLGKAALEARIRWLDPAGEPLPPERHPITRALRGAEPSIDVACGVETPAEELSWLSLNAAPLVDPRTREIRGAVVSFHDVTARKKVDRMKSEFVSTVSHELRTPLASVRGALGLLAGGVAGPLTESLGQMVDIALSNVERLSRLVDDILDVEKIDSGRMPLHLAALPLAPLLHHAEVSNRPFVTPLGIRVELHVAPELVVHVDPDRFQQVMTNLLSNAAKFSPPGGLVTVRASAAASRVRIEVHDDGPGIPAEFRDRIFERFSQADGSDRRRHGGTGLGLSIVKGLVDRMGGAVSFVSEAGQGTTFIVELPAR
jgi:PAS domain S-box-containing protein